MNRLYFCGTILLGAFFSPVASAQEIQLHGTVRDAASGELVPSVSVVIKGSAQGTFTNERGIYRFSLSGKLPLTLVFSSIGFQTLERELGSLAELPLDVRLEPISTLGAEVVVSASRIPENIMRSPVSIDRINAGQIRQMPATGYYDLLRQIKGVDMIYSSLTFATPSTRGFNGSGNARLNQLVDGMDNQAPGLNFSVGTVIGVTELDVESIELLHGASSALYGPGGMNGTILINSKDPFRYQGLSFQVREGIMHVDRRQRGEPSAYHDWSLRWGKKISERFAFKFGAQFVHAKDWIADDRTNYQAGDLSRNEYGNVKPGDRVSDPNYDGVNVYGDETSVDLADPAQPVLVLVSDGIQTAMAADPNIPAPLVAAGAAFLDSIVAVYPNLPVSRTGYDERDVVNNNTINLKLSGGLYYKLSSNLEASLVGYWGTGNTVYTGSDRYSLRNLKIGQYKLELRNTDWFFRVFTTQENAGESYNATITTRIFNEAWKPSADWFQQYAEAFLSSKLTPYLEALAGGPGYQPVPDPIAHNGARAFADQGRPAPGTEAFYTLFDQIRGTPISEGGGLFLDRSDLYQAEGQYNFGTIGEIGDLLAGASYRRYVLNSAGTLFAETDGNIHIREIGAYAQLSRNFLANRLRLTASGRYDKNQNFRGRFTPRFTALYALRPDHQLRASYQTAYRFPTTQNQWINLVIGGGTVLLGGLPELRDLYDFAANKVYSVPSVGAAGAALESGADPQAALGLLEEVRFGEYKPETLRSVEFGYKGLFQRKLLLDAYVYFGWYENFLGRRVVLQSLDPGDPMGLFSSSTRRSISVAVNSGARVRTYGFALAGEYRMPENFQASANISVDKIGDVEQGFVSFFNVPSYRLMLGFGNTGFGRQDRFGFQVSLRNQDGYYFESDFRQGMIEGFTTVDAQVSCKFPVQRTLLKVGATNLFNTYYRTAFGNPEMGGVYYVSLGYNVF